jgi:hypothetical protein
MGASEYKLKRISEIPNGAIAAQVPTLHTNKSVLEVDTKEPSDGFEFKSVLLV